MVVKSARSLNAVLDNRPHYLQRSAPMIGNENAWFLWLPLGEEIRADRVVKQLLTMNILRLATKDGCQKRTVVKRRTR
jgi:hypothetical protein